MKRLTCLLTLALLLGPSSGHSEEKRPSPDPAALVKGNTQTALDLYAQLRARKGNLFFSPYSISTALQMTYLGARQETAEEMARTLHLPTDLAKLPPAAGALYKQINGGKKREYQLSTANALWGQKGYPFLPEFTRTARTSFDAGLRELDFARAPEESRKTINGWVEEKTRNKIKDLLPPGSIKGQTKLVLTNAIYFLGNWETQFDKDGTREQLFHLGKDRTVKVPMMVKKDHCGYLDTRDFQALALPYKGGELALVVLLPKKRDGLAEFEKGLSADKLAGWLGRMRPEKVQVSLPCFKMTAEFTLNDVLSKMGMQRAFTRQADFSGMNGRTDLYLSLVIHKAFVEVNERGTEAAAATGIVADPKSADVRPIREFRADHPFVFLIRDTRSGSILFLGRLARP